MRNAGKSNNRLESLVLRPPDLGVGFQPYPFTSHGPNSACGVLGVQLWMGLKGNRPENHLFGGPRKDTPMFLSTWTAVHNIGLSVYACWRCLNQNPRPRGMIGRHTEVRRHNASSNERKACNRLCQFSLLSSKNNRAARFQ